MSYLNGPTSTGDYGVVEVGSNINVLDGVISLAQDVSPTANVHFVSVQSTTLFQGSSQVVDRVTPSAGFGIGLSNVTTAGPTPAFTITNTGVTTLTAGTGIALSGSTGNITVSSTGTSVINTIGVTNNYTATATDEYIGCNTSSAITITLPAGTEGRTFVVKDENGGSPKITVTGSNNEKIDGANSKSLSIGYSSISLVFRASGWHII